MQTLPPKKWPYWNKLCAKRWNLWKNNFRFSNFWDMVYFVLNILRKLTKISLTVVKKICPKRCALFWNACKIYFPIFAIFIFWVMVNFVLKILRKLGLESFLRTWFRNANQSYPISSWPEGSNRKASGAWGHVFNFWTYFVNTKHLNFFLSIQNLFEIQIFHWFIKTYIVLTKYVQNFEEILTQFFLQRSLCLQNIGRVISMQ